MEMDRRPLQVGDYVSVLLDGRYYQYPITAIKTDRIIADDYQITYINGTWKVVGLPYYHTLSFHKEKRVYDEHKGLTGIDDTDLLIMKMLPTFDLMNLCRTNTNYVKLCARDDLWMSRILKEHGPIIYKPEWLSLYQYYIAKTLSPKDAAAAGDITMLNWMRDLGKDIKVRDLIEAIEHGMNDFIISDIDLGDLIKYDTVGTALLLDKAAETGNLTIMKYIFETAHRTGLLLRPDHRESFKKEVKRGHVNMIYVHDWMAVNRSWYDYNNALFLAMKNGHTDIVTWLMAHGAKNDRGFFAKAIESGDPELILRSVIVNTDLSKYNLLVDVQINYGRACSPETLTMLQMKGAVFTELTAASAAGQSSTRSLQWLFDQGIIPNSTAYEYAVAYDRLDSLIWLKKNGIDLDDIALQNCLYYWSGKLEILDWIVTNYPDLPLPLVVLTNNLDMRDDVNGVIWFISHGYDIIDSNFLVYRMEHNHINVLKYVQKTYPDKFKQLTTDYSLTICARNGYLTLFQWFLSLGYTPTLEAGVMAARAGYVEIAELCYRKGVDFSRANIMQHFLYYGQDPLKDKNFNTIGRWLRDRKIQY